MRYSTFLVTLAACSLSQVAWADPYDDATAPRRPLPENPPMTLQAPQSQGAIDSWGSGAIPALPLEVQTSGNITYVTGGIGDEELAQIKSTASQYNTQLLFTATEGNYVSDVTLRFTDAQGTEVLAVEGTGPYFYAHMPSGTYSVSASSAAGGSKTIKMHVPAKGAARQHLVFKVQD